MNLKYAVLLSGFVAALEQSPPALASPCRSAVNRANCQNGFVQLRSARPHGSGSELHPRRISLA